MKFQINFNN